MRNITLTDEQFQQLLDILDSAKEDATGWMYEYATSKKEEEAVEEYCKGVDAIIALLEQATKRGEETVKHMPGATLPQSRVERP